MRRPMARGQVVVNYYQNRLQNVGAGSAMGWAEVAIELVLIACSVRRQGGACTCRAHGGRRGRRWCIYPWGATGY